MDLPHLDADQWQALGSVGTCLAAVVALVAVTLQEVSRKRERSDRDQAQARGVVLLPSVIQSTLMQVKIQNFSDGPIGQVALTRILWADEHGQTTNWRLASTVGSATDYWLVLGPGEVAQTYVEFVTDSKERRDLTAKGISYSIAFEFVDRAGLLWRSGTPGLKRLRERSPHQLRR